MGGSVQSFMASHICFSFVLSLLLHRLVGLFGLLLRIFQVFLVVLELFLRFLFMQAAVVVDVHDEEEETAGQDDPATHEEEVQVVLVDVHQEACRENNGGWGWGGGISLRPFDKTNVFPMTTDRTKHFLIRKHLQLNSDLAVTVKLTTGQVERSHLEK